MNESTIASRYAKALFEVAVERNILEIVKSDMLLVNKTCKVEEIENFLQNPIIDIDKKVRIFNQAFLNKINILSLKFLKLVIKAKRENLISFITINFLRRYKIEKNLKTVQLSTASSIHKNSEQKLVSILSEGLKSNIDLEKLIDDSLIGGFVVKIDDLQYDVSIKTQLHKTEKILLKTK